MDLFNQVMDTAIEYIGVGLEFVASYLLTMEGIIAMIFFTFLAGLIGRIRYG